MKVSLPPKQYPQQKDYGELIFEAHSYVKELNLCFLEDDLDRVVTLGAELTYVATDLLSLAGRLLIERNNNEFRDKKWQPTQEEIQSRARANSEDRIKTYLERRGGGSKGKFKT